MQTCRLASWGMEQDGEEQKLCHKRPTHRITSLSGDLTKSEFPHCDPFRNDDNVDIEVYVSIVLKKPLYVYFEGNKFKH